MTTIPPEVPPAVDYYKRAEEIIETIRAQVQRIEGFGHPDSDRRRRIAGYSANITDVELNAAARACDAEPQLAVSAHLTGAQFRDGISFCDANAKILEALQLQIAGVAYATKLKRAELANSARLVYQVAQSLNKPANVELLIPYIDKLREVFKRPKKRTATTAPTNPPVSTTPPVSNQPSSPDVPAATAAVVRRTT